MLGSSLNKRANAAQQFHRARRQAGIEALLARLRGHSAELLSYEEVVSALHVRGQSTAGLKQVPIAAIVGSVGRYNDFSRTFLPLRETDQDRWVAVRTAAPHIGDLPPVDLYRIGEAYFVLDGNHRVSIARQQALAYIDAYVTEVQTRVPLPSGDSPDAMIIAAEYADFLEWTGLDRARPDADLRVSVPGQYAHLENHIEAFRFVTEINEDQELPLQAAILRWYDDAYTPLAEAIRQQGILRYFPKRTETDFYIWLATHRIALQNELGIHVAPEVAASRFLAQVAGRGSTPRLSVGQRVRRRFTRLVVADDTATEVQAAEAQSRAVARYTDRLFKDILVPVDLSRTPLGEAAVRQALALAVEEDARLCVACIDTGDKSTATADAIAQFMQDVAHRTNTLQLTADCLADQITVSDLTGKMAALYDLIVIDRSFGAGAGERAPSAILAEILRDSHRPVWMAAPVEDQPVYSHIILGLDDSGTGREALFIATYLAERWQAGLTILPLASRHGGDILRFARPYLAMHEINSEIIDEQIPFTADIISRLATDHACDLLILPGISSTSKDSHEDVLMTLIEQWPHALLLAAWG